jgi:hypothetical protein
MAIERGLRQSERTASVDQTDARKATVRHFGFGHGHVLDRAHADVLEIGVRHRPHLSGSGA